MLELRLVRRHARADHDQVLIAKCALAVPPCFNGNAPVEKLRHLVLQLGFTLRVGYRDLGAVFLEKKGSRHARAPQADYQHPFVLEVHHRE